jgi:predicted acyltransferase
VLLVLAAALIAGIAPRASAAIASVLMLEIVVALMATGLSDTALRDVGVLGLAVVLTGAKHQRLVLRD